MMIDQESAKKAKPNLSIANVKNDTSDAKLYQLASEHFQLLIFKGCAVQDGEMIDGPDVGNKKSTTPLLPPQYRLHTYILLSLRLELCINFT